MSKFKVGDRVVTTSSGLYSDVSVGDKGFIVDGCGRKPHGCCVKLDKYNYDYLFFYWGELELAPHFPINRGDYIDSREFTREECERFCELAVECGFKVSDKNCGRYTEYGVTDDGLIWACYQPDIVGMNNNITTQFREFLDKEKSMKQLTKNDLKDGMRVELRNGKLCYVCGEQLVFKYQGANWTAETSLCHFSYELTDTDGDNEYDIIRVTDRDGTVLFEREEEPRELTLKEIADQFGVPVERIRIKK